MVSYFFDRALSAGARHSSGQAEKPSPQKLAASVYMAVMWYSPAPAAERGSDAADARNCKMSFWLRHLGSQDLLYKLENFVGCRDWP